MSALDRTGRWNPGGGHYLELIEATNVTGYVQANRLASPVVSLSSGTSWKRLYCTPGTMGYTIKHDKTPNGDLYSVDVRGFHPGDDVQFNNALSAFVNDQRVLVRFRTYSGRTLLFGTKDEPLEFSYQNASGEDVPDSSGYAISITGQLTQPPAYL